MPYMVCHSVPYHTIPYHSIPHHTTPHHSLAYPSTQADPSTSHGDLAQVFSTGGLAQVPRHPLNQSPPFTPPLTLPCRLPLHPRLPGPDLPVLGAGAGAPPGPAGVPGAGHPPLHRGAAPHQPRPGLGGRRRLPQLRGGQCPSFTLHYNSICPITSTFTSIFHSHPSWARAG